MRHLYQKGILAEVVSLLYVDHRLSPISMLDTLNRAVMPPEILLLDERKGCRRLGGSRGGTVAGEENYLL